MSPARWSCATFLTALLATLPAAADTVLETGDRLFPTPAATWKIQAVPFALEQVTESISGHTCLRQPGGVRFRNGKTAEALTPDRESVQAGVHGVTANQQFTDLQLTAAQRLTVVNDTLVWEVTLESAAATAQWLEVKLTLPVQTTAAERYWDGRTERAAAGAPLARQALHNTFPVAFLYGREHGLAVGVPPTLETSFLENGIDKDGRLVYGTRQVVVQGQPARITFLLYLEDPTFGSRAAVHGYYQRFPASFAPAAGVDPRLIDGRRTDSLQVCQYGGVKDARTALWASQYDAGFEWGYALFRREGDYVGRKEYWDLELTEGEQKRLQEDTAQGAVDRSDWERFHQTRAAYFRNADMRGNIVMGFYLVNHVEKGLTEKLGLLDYAFPRTTSVGLLERNWVLPYSAVYYLYPWATPYETILRRDLPEVVQELGLYAFAHDLYGEPPETTPYRKTLDYPVPGWSYDEEGPFISQALGYRRQTDFIHTLRQGERTIGLIANGLNAAHPLCAFAPDAFISESRPTEALKAESREQYLHCRLFAGHKPVYQHGYASGILLGDLVPWETLTPEECRAVYDDFVRDYLVYLYQAGLTPSRHLSEVHEVISQEQPILLEVLCRGFEPVAACVGNTALERVRYGAGLGAAVVLSNRTETPVSSDERLLGRYLGEPGLVVPAEMRGGELPFTFGAEGTRFPLTVAPLENRILAFPVAVRAEQALTGSGRCVTDVEALRRTYRILLDLPAPAAVKVVVAPDPGFEVERLQCQGQTLPADGAARLPAGASTLTVETVSSLIHATLPTLAQFPFAEAGIALPDPPAERETAAAQMLRDFVEVRLQKVPALQQAAGLPQIRIGRVPTGGRRGVSLEGATLTIQGTDPFDTQQITWDLLRFLDRHDRRFGPTPAALYAGGDAATTEMLKKAGLLRQWVAAVKTPKRLAWNGFPTPSRAAAAAVVRAEDLRALTVPRLDTEPVLDGRLDEPVWQSAAVADGFSLLKQPETRPTQATEVRVFRTANALLVGFVCHEANMDKVLAQMSKRDAAVWNDDVFELRLAPGVAGTAAKYVYYALLVNSVGTQADLEQGGSGLAWNAEWECRVQRDASSWSGELRLPLRALPGSEAVGWRANFSRFEKPNAEYSTWSPIPEDLADQPARFGILKLP